MQVTDDNLYQVLPKLEAQMKTATYISIDFEMVGLHHSDDINTLDSMEQRYQKMICGPRAGFSAVEFGLTVSHINEETQQLDHSVYTMHLFPSTKNLFFPKSPLEVPNILMSPSSIDFLSEHNFNFGSWFNDVTDLAQSNSQRPHSAGYDSFLTAKIFGYLVLIIGQNKPFDCTSNPHDIAPIKSMLNSTIFKWTYLNRINLVNSIFSANIGYQIPRSNKDSFILINNNTFLPPPQRSDNFILILDTTKAYELLLNTGKIDSTIERAKIIHSLTDMNHIKNAMQTSFIERANEFGFDPNDVSAMPLVHISPHAKLIPNRFVFHLSIVLKSGLAKFAKPLDTQLKLLNGESWGWKSGNIYTTEAFSTTLRVAFDCHEGSQLKDIFDCFEILSIEEYFATQVVEKLSN